MSCSHLYSNTICFHAHSLLIASGISVPCVLVLQEVGRNLTMFRLDELAEDTGNGIILRIAGRDDDLFDSTVDGVGEDMYWAEEEEEEEEVGMWSPGMWRCLICTSEAGFKVLNSCKALSAKTSSLSTHWFSESGYPFHLTRYCSFCLLLNRCKSRILSTSYSSTLSTKSGGGR